MKAFRKRISTRMVRLENNAETTYNDLLGTIEGLKHRPNPMTIYNAGVAEFLVARGIAREVLPGHFLCENEDARAMLETEVRALHYRKTRKK